MCLLMSREAGVWKWMNLRCLGLKVGKLSSNGRRNSWISSWIIILWIIFLYINWQTEYWKPFLFISPILILIASFSSWLWYCLCVSSWVQREEGILTLSNKIVKIAWDIGILLSCWSLVSEAWAEFHSPLKQQNFSFPIQLCRWSWKIGRQLNNLPARPYLFHLLKHL